MHSSPGSEFDANALLDLTESSGWKLAVADPWDGDGDDDVRVVFGEPPRDFIQLVRTHASNVRVALERRAQEARATEADARLAKTLGISLEEARARREEREARERETRRRAWLEALDAHRRNVVDRYRERMDHQTAEALAKGDLKPSKAMQVVDTWIDTASPYLVLSGGTGCGKTVASIYALTRLDLEELGQMIRAIRLGAHFERWSSDRDIGIEPIYFDSKLLVIDDLGEELMADRRTLPALEEVLDARIGANRRTLFTTNLTMSQIRERYTSARIHSRLAAYATFVSLDGEDMRIQKRGEHR